MGWPHRATPHSMLLLYHCRCRHRCSRRRGRFLHFHCHFSHPNNSSCIIVFSSSKNVQINVSRVFAHFPGFLLLAFIWCPLVYFFFSVAVQILICLPFGHCCLQWELNERHTKRNGHWMIERQRARDANVQITRIYATNLRPLFANRLSSVKIFFPCFFQWHILESFHTMAIMPHRK